MNLHLPEHGMLRTISDALRTPVRPGRHGYLRFGWILMMLLLAQAISGILLSIYYQASPDLASESVEYIMRDVHWGWLLRGIHHWASILMLWLIGFQVVRVVALGSYRAARGSTWVLGLVLLVLVLAFAITGDLLPWDDSAYWGTDALLATVEELPLLGPRLATILRGGVDIGAGTLARLYTIHALLLPGITFGVLFVHLWMLSRRRSAGRGSVQS